MKRSVLVLLIALSLCGCKQPTDASIDPSKTDETSTSTNQFDAFMHRLETDVLLGTSWMAWTDQYYGTSFLSAYYIESGQQWARAIHSAENDFIIDLPYYEKVLDDFFQYLEIHPYILDRMFQNMVVKPWL